MIMSGKKGIVMGLSNKFSIGYGIAKALKECGASLILTSQTEYFQEKISDIASELEAAGSYICNVSEDGKIEETFKKIYEEHGAIDFVVHSIAFSDKNELKGKYYETTRANFLNAMNVSCFSFTEVCKFAKEIMPNGGSVLPLTYYGSEKVIQNYNVMALVKAALETSVKYLANDLGEFGIRVNAVSAGPIKTLAASGISEFSKMLEYDKNRSPLRRNVSQKDIGDAAVFLLSEMASGITGEILHVDCGCNIVGIKL